MLFGMTGYGAARAETSATTLQVELRSVNHRGLDIHCHLPSSLNPIERQLIEIIRQRCARGRIDLRVNLNAQHGPMPVLDGEALRAAYQALFKASEETALQSSICMSDVLTAPNLWHSSSSEELSSDTTELLLELCARAVDGLVDTRRSEGLALQTDLEAQLGRIEGALQAAELRAPERLAEYERRLRERIAELGSELSLDPHRLSMELAVLADRADLNEELCRAKLHTHSLRQEFSTSRTEKDAIGRKLDFICQELARELSTMAAKSRDAELATLTVDMRSALESMREQLANVQ